MDIQHQQTSRLLSAVPTLDAAFDDSESSQNRLVLQERSANWPHDYLDTNTSPIKTSNSPGPTENVYERRCPPAGAYFTGNVHAQHIGLAGFTVERSEKQIRVELERLYKLLGRSDKYQKYREKQPQLTRSELIAREAADRKAAEHRGSKEEKDKSVWPDFLENAFWRGECHYFEYHYTFTSSSSSHDHRKPHPRWLCITSQYTVLTIHLALVKWPPMGRKKYMLDGALRGRNELIQDSIRKDTGIIRCRKQVSSHLQVLKQHLRDQKEGEWSVSIFSVATKPFTARSDHGAQARTCHVEILDLTCSCFRVFQSISRNLPYCCWGVSLWWL
jgi:transcriptional enhancer factor